MRATLSGLVAVGLCAIAAPAYAQADHQPLNNLGDHIAIPGMSGRQAFTYDFVLNGFQSTHSRLFAVGILSGGNLPSPQSVAIPIGRNRDHNGAEGSGEHRDSFGALQRPPWIQPAVFQPDVFRGAGTPLIVQAQATGTCQILNLNLQPLNLNLLGLVVNLQAVVLDITAVQGAGNLLGNLLCAVAGLINP